MFLLLLLIHIISFVHALVVPPLSTQNATIVDSSGRPIRLACVNWYGAHMARYVVDGLDRQPLSYIVDRIGQLGFNCVRLVYSLDLFYVNPRVDALALTQNPDLVGLSGMEIFDKVVTALTSANIMVILNNHISKAGWCCSVTDGEGLWWTTKYPEDVWLTSLTQITRRYEQNKFVVGFDLRNEIRRTIIHVPSWGDGHLLTDWRRAATIGGNTVLASNKDLLIIVEGLDFAIDMTKMLSPKVSLNVNNKLVYSGHIYSWSWPNTDWSTLTYESFRDRLQKTQSFVVTEAGIPYFLGEFGENTESTYWKYLMRFLRETGYSWSLWALNGYQGTPSKDETFGILGGDWSSVRYDWMLRDLRAISP